MKKIILGLILLLISISNSKSAEERVYCYDPSVGPYFVYWCNPFEPINKGKLGTTQGWRKEESFKKYY
jgi:hypothetical protein